MIEIIYDKDKIEKTEQNKDTNENEISIGLKLPKNIRQVGAPASNKRIYIEDYVVTYLNYIARPGSTQARGAILLGEVKKSDLGNVIFISGAVDAQNIEFDMEESEFTQEAWSAIYEQVKEYFPSLSVVGWFLSRMGFSTAINDKIEKMHIDNFPGRDKVLFVSDSLEGEDAFYMYERGQLLKQKGYYIYYSKNEAMQNYIVSRRTNLQEEKTEIQRKDEELIKKYRSKTKSNVDESKNNNNSLLYAASAIFALGIITMGVSIVNSHDRMKDMEVTINRLELTAEQDVTENTPAMYQDDDFSKEYATPTNQNNNSDNENINELIDTNNQNNALDKEDSFNGANNNYQEKNINGEIKPKESNQQNINQTLNQQNRKTSKDDNITKEQYLPAISSGNPTYYTIKKGDSLTTIAYEFYGDIIYAKEIAKANKININDEIYEGEEIILPDVNWINIFCAVVNKKIANLENEMYVTIKIKGMQIQNKVYDIKK